MPNEHEFNPNDPAHCDACFKEGETRLSANRAHQLDATKLIAREGWDCAKCGHRHAGLTLANICVGCPCPETTPLDTAEDDWIRIASQNAQDAADRLKLLQILYEKALDQRDSALAELADTRRFWKAAKDALQAEKIASQVASKREASDSEIADIVAFMEAVFPAGVATPAFDEQHVLATATKLIADLRADNKGLRLETNIQRERNRELDEAHKRLIRDHERLIRAPKA